MSIVNINMLQKMHPTMNCVYYMYYITPDGIDYHKHFILVITNNNMISAVSDGGEKSLTILSQG